MADRIEDGNDRLPSNVRIRRSATDNIGKDRSACASSNKCSRTRSWLCIVTMSNGEERQSMKLCLLIFVSISCVAAEPPTANPEATKPDVSTTDAAKPVTKSATKPAASANAGYLAKANAGPLRFAPVAPVRSTAALPALPLTRDPQPTRPPEFPKIVEGPQTIVTTRAPETVLAVYPPADQSASTTKGAADLGSAVYLTPQGLVRFFPNGKPMSVDALVNLPFQVPVRVGPEGSSATYTIR